MPSAAVRPSLLLYLVACSYGWGEEVALPTCNERDVHRHGKDECNGTMIIHTDPVDVHGMHMSMRYVGAVSHALHIWLIGSRDF